MRDYLSGSMIQEECHALEHHINDCPFCSQALDGMAVDTTALDVVGNLNTSFLTEQFAVIEPHVHLNGIGGRRHAHKHNHKPLYFTGTVALIILLAAGIMWFVENRRVSTTSAGIIHTQTTAYNNPSGSGAGSIAGSHVQALVTINK